jgi:hypothetical protein
MKTAYTIVQKARVIRALSIDCILQARRLHLAGIFSRGERQSLPGIFDFNLIFIGPLKKSTEAGP